MRLGKNKKKQWRRCVPGIEEEIIKAKEVNQIDNVSFDISNTTASGKGKDVKYSTVPRRFIKRPNISYPAKEIVDIWADDYVAPVLSKRRQALMDGMTRYKKPIYAVHPGTSYQPLESDHIDLLHKLKVDFENKTRALRMAEKKMEVPLEDETQIKTTEEEEVEEIVENEDYVKKDPLRKVRLLTRREKRRKIQNVVKEKLMSLEKKKGKSEAHLLRNIPQLKKQIVQIVKEQVVRKKEREAKSEVRKEQLAETKSLEKVSYLLPSEVPTCLRKLVADGDIFCDVTEKFDGHKFKADKRKKHKQWTKCVKKNGLAK